MTPTRLASGNGTRSELVQSNKLVALTTPRCSIGLRVEGSESSGWGEDRRYILFREQFEGEPFPSLLVCEIPQRARAKGGNGWMDVNGHGNWSLRITPFSYSPLCTVTRFLRAFVALGKHETLPDSRLLPRRSFQLYDNCRLICLARFLS